MPLTDFQQQYGGGGAFQFMDKSGFNAGGQAVSRYTAPTPAMPTTTQPLPSTPTTTVPTPAVNRYTATSNKPTLQAVDENSIRETTRKNMQAQIDAINAQYTNLIAQEQVAGEDRSGQTRAMNARGGLAGSDFGTAQANKTQQFNQQQIKSLEDQKASAVNSVLMNIEDRATAEIQRRKQEALGQYERDFDEYKMEQEKARGDFASLAKSGVDLSTLAPEQKQALFQQAGYDEGMGELIYNAMKPKAAQIDYKFEKLADGKGLFYGVDPITGELKTQNVSVSVPDGFSMTIAPDGTPLIFNKDTGEAQIAEGFGQGQFKKPEDPLDQTKKQLEIQQLLKNMNGRGDLLPTEKDRAAFNQIVGKYSASPLIAASDRTVVLKNTVQAVKRNPADAALQMNLAYGYIQALDTYQSAVREGELNNVNSIDSKIGQLQNWVEQMTNGQKVRPEVATQIADAADKLVGYIGEGAKKKEQMFASQARINGIENAWNEFRGGFQTNYDTPEVGAASQDNTDKLKLLMEQGFTFEEANEAVTEELGSFKQVGGDTHKASYGTIKLGSNLARANNNPGNLRYVGQEGAKQGKGGFASFPTPEAGVKALENQIALDTKRGHTLQSFINKYAPPVENNTSLYLQQAIKALGASANTLLSKLNRKELVKFMAKKESSTIIS